MDIEATGNPDNPDQDAQPPGNGITTPLDAENAKAEDPDDGDNDDASAEV